MASELRFARLVPFFALALAGCPSPEPPAPAPFDVVLEDLEGALLSVHGTSATDVWTVGGAGIGTTGIDGEGPATALHFDGTRWTMLDLSPLEGIDLWWVHAFADGTVMIGGEGGTILRRAAGATTFETMTTPGTGTVFGIWGASSSDAWAVGGLGGSGGFVWRLVSGAWTEVDLPAEHPGAAVFKVWGNDAEDVWFCGLMGTLMHLEGGALEMVESPSTRSLFTIHTDGEAIVAVGGAGSGVVLEASAGGGFRDVTPTGGVQMNGVWLTEDGRGWAVGYQSEMMRRTAPGAWASHDPGVFIGHDLHSVWVDPAGGVWAVGGEILSEPLIQGILVHSGPDVPSTVVME